LELLLFLILFPLLTAFLCLALPEHPIRRWVIRVSGVLIGAGAVYLLVTSYNKGTQLFDLPHEPAGVVMQVIIIAIAIAILYLAVKYRKPAAVALILVQTAIVQVFELQYAHALEVEANLFIDEFSIIMALIIGVIGSLICIYAISYMRCYHEHHPEVEDRRRFFFFIMFVFLSAMFGIVFSNDLLWFFRFWEVTTLASFLLIGYSRTEEAINNAFTALQMNLLGGIGFAVALLYIGMTGAPLGLDRLLEAGPAIALVPAVLIAFAGITKSAQLPFSSWLLGAMVAPTPVSALLHSSTMVKAGVYAIVKFAPVLAGTVPGLMVALVGGTTFFLASAMAITQSNAKRLLAYSTIANLGLVVACGGIGTYEAVWAAILLIIFHAVAKSLLFLGVGTVEHQIHSRDIEDMDGLIVTMPRVAAMILIGITGMFLAPFGMLISKWASLRAFIDAPGGLVFVLLIAFGSGVTLFFWTKWLGRLITRPRVEENVEGRVNREELSVLFALSALVIGVCLLFPWIARTLIEPYVLEIYGQVTQLSQDNTIIMILMLVMILVLPLTMLYFRNGRDRRKLDVYMGGRPTTTDMHFAGSAGIDRQLTLHNYYLEGYFGEGKLMKIGVVVTVLLILTMLELVIVPAVIA
jgi:ech hydrogenase subunit A